MTLRFFRAPLLLTLSCALSLPLLAQASDWPQWRGPARDGVSTETGLLKTWPEAGPNLLWKASGLGGGYSAPAVLGDSLYASGYRGEDEVVWALDLATGKERWSTRVAVAAREMDYPEGPRATPTLDGGQLFTLGGGGNLVCLDTKTGELTWSVELHKSLGGSMMSEWGYSESPLVDGDHVICTPGGEQGTVAALNRKTGEVVWRSTELKDPAAYSSLIRIEFGGQAQYVVLTGQSIAGISAKDGSLLWRHERVGKTAVVPTPIFTEGFIWVTSGYGVGCNLFKLSEAEGKIQVGQVYKNRTIKNGQGGAVRVGDHVFAFSGPLLVCMNWRTGERVWRARSFNRACLVYADGHLIARGEKGEVALIEANSKEFVLKSSFEESGLSTFKSWAHPVVSGGRLYLRDQDSMSCFDIKSNE